MPTIDPRDIVSHLLRSGEIHPLDIAMSSALPIQRDMILSNERTKAAVCGRRSGKTTCAALALLNDARNFPSALYPYVLLTKSSGRDIVWPVLRELDFRYTLGLKFDEHALRLQLRNGATIAIMGADDKRDMERLRGSKYRIAIIDEAGSFPRDMLRYLVSEVMEPATMDLQGSVWIIGTPNIAAQGYFYDLTAGATPKQYNDGQCATWHWTALENSHLPHMRDEFERILKKRGWAWDTPAFRREYLGEWVRDASGLVYRFNKQRHVQRAPEDLTRFVLAIDLGTSATQATTAFVLLGYRDTGRSVWVTSATKEAAMSPDSIADRIQTFQKSHNIEKIVCDAGGLGGGYIRHFNETRRLCVEPAEKKDKSGAIEMCNGELDSGRLFIDPGCHQLIAEIEILPWNEERTDAASGAADHLADALLYGQRATMAYANQLDAVEAPKPGTEEYNNAWTRNWRERWSKQQPKREWWERRGK